MSGVSREQLRQALADQVPDGAEYQDRVVAGRICVAAMRRRGLQPWWVADGQAAEMPCYYASSEYSTNCMGDVALNGDNTVVTGSAAADHGCIREQEIDDRLDWLADRE